MHKITTTIAAAANVTAAPRTVTVGATISGRQAAIALLLLTVFAGAIRFTRLDRPPLLIDECFTFWRTCGSYGDLVETLRDDGFVPLHYELLWWIKQGMPLTPHTQIIRGGLYQTPIVMRFVPAVCGTLMVPVMFFVARQLFGRRIALLAALFTACSAYALFFSRDSKMYSPAWMLATLATGCLFWWLRTRSTTAWLAWVAAGAAAAGVHVVTLLLLPLAPIALLTQRTMHWRQALLMIAGAALIAAGPAGYYLGFNRWAQRSGGLLPGVTSEPAPDANWTASGLNWLPETDGGGSDVFEPFATYLTGYEWDGTTNAVAGNWNPNPRWLGHTIIAAGSVICGFIALGLLPWPKQWRSNDPAAAWRSALWLGCWIAVPAYCFFYCRSFEDAASPRDWLAMIAGWWAGGRWMWLIPITIALAVTGSRVRLAGQILGAIVAVAALTIIVLRAGGLMSDVTLAPWLARSLVCTMLAIVPAALWAFAGSSDRERLRTTAQVAASVAIVLAICAGAHAVWSSLRAESLAKHPELQWHTIWHTRYIGIIWPAVWIAAAALMMRLPTRPFRIIAILAIILPNLANGIARFTMQTQVPYDRLFADVWAAKTGAPVRTYFDLSEVFFATPGFPTYPYWRPEAAYNACLAGRIATNPVEFRTGKAWPFEYGPVLVKFTGPLVYRPTVSPANIADDLRQSPPEVHRAIVWSVSRTLEPSMQELKEQLGAAWRPVSDETIDVWYNWTWSQRMTFHRREFQRGSSP
jgi:hypothetical protein